LPASNICALKLKHERHRGLNEFVKKIFFLALVKKHMRKMDRHQLNQIYSNWLAISKHLLVGPLYTIANNLNNEVWPILLLREHCSLSGGKLKRHSCSSNWLQWNARAV